MRLIRRDLAALLLDAGTPEGPPELQALRGRALPLYRDCPVSADGDRPGPAIASKIELRVDLPPTAQPIVKYASLIFSRPSFRESLSDAEQEMRLI